MSLLHLELEARLHAAVRAVLPDADLSQVRIQPCPDPKFGDYQTPGIMVLAKQRKANPRQLATDVLAKLDVAEWCEKVEIAGAGFLNFRLKPAALSAALAVAAGGGPLFFQPAAQPRTIVIDFSSPNVAKPMHVGHIRSTILGDSLARTLRLLGHRVVTDNHLGDWGTQFGMLLIGWKTLLDKVALEHDAIAELERIYKQISAGCKEDPAMLDRARAELVKLQASDPKNLAIWREMIRLSQVQFDTIYGRLGVRFDHTLGESFYNDQIPKVYDELTSHGIAVESEGALVVFNDETNAPVNIKGHPFIIRKRDGAANYASTDLATILHRKEHESFKADVVLYVVDSRQRDHFDHLFFTVHKWFTKTHRNPPELKLVNFGTILGDDNRPLKTRSGDNVKLRDLLDEAEERALKLASEKRPELDESQRREIARVVGIGAVKYQDLLPNRTSDYVFSWDKMLSLQGNTGPYLQYAYTRIASIQRKADEQSAIRNPQSAIILAAPEEFALARHLLNFGITLEAVAAEYKPNLLCNYLFELAGWVMRFLEACPVLKAAETERASRLALCDLTRRVLKQGLEALGIETLEQM